MNTKEQSSVIVKPNLNVDISDASDGNVSLPNSWGIRQSLAQLVSQGNCKDFAEGVQKYLAKQVGRFVS